VVYETGNRTIDDAVDSILDGGQIDRTDAIALLAQPVNELATAADSVRATLGDGTVDACSIVNAKAGNCAEDCGFCAQSAHFDTGIDTHDLLDPETILDAAKRAERDGAQRFGIVVAEKGVSKEKRPDEWADVVRAVRLIRDETSFVATHSFEDRLKTLRRAKNAGIDLCAGVILGMGETPADRVDAALELRKIGVSSLPVNILNPVAGTPLGDRETAAISTTDLIKTIAVYRLLHPTARVRITGGREVNLEADQQQLPFEAGADGILTGDYLTTDGQSAGTDIEVIEEAGLRPNMEANEFDPEAVKADQAMPESSDD